MRCLRFTDETAAGMPVGGHAFVMPRSFFDLDGHGWPVMWIDPAAAERGPEAFAASGQHAEAAA